MNNVPWSRDGVIQKTVADWTDYRKTYSATELHGTRVCTIEMIREFNGYMTL